MAEKFVLVGDHYQLPPLFAQSEESTSEPVSLFKYLSEAHPIAISYLKLQYRMNEDIMKLANELVYDNRLDCGNNSVRFAKLQTPLKETFIKEIHEGARCKSNCWLEHLLDPKNSVVFCDTDMMPALESKQSQMIDNQIEVELVYQTVTALIKSGVEQTDIGVVSPYRYQLQKLSKALSCYPLVELLTVDKFQGRDKKCIIMSLVRSNEFFQAGELVKDWRRVNVAVTRAEQKFILFGSRKTVGSSICFGNLFALLRRMEWVLQLPTQAQSLHEFESHEGNVKVVSKFGDCNIDETLEF
jgi:DNA replication ATP-dependent helicase Dna2